VPGAKRQAQARGAQRAAPRSFKVVCIRRCGCCESPGHAAAVQDPDSAHQRRAGVDAVRRRRTHRVALVPAQLLRGAAQVHRPHLPPAVTGESRTRSDINHFIKTTCMRTHWASRKLQLAALQRPGCDTTSCGLTWGACTAEGTASLVKSASSVLSLHDHASRSDRAWTDNKTQLRRCSTLHSTSVKSAPPASRLRRPACRRHLRQNTKSRPSASLVSLLRRIMCVFKDAKTYLTSWFLCAKQTCGQAWQARPLPYTQAGMWMFTHS